VEEAELVAMLVFGSEAQTARIRCQSMMILFVTASTADDARNLLFHTYRNIGMGIPEGAKHSSLTRL
jgi:hypothetical protein